MSTQDLVTAMQFDFGPVTSLNPGAAPHVVTYAFHDARPAGPSLVGQYGGWTPFTAAERAETREALSEIEGFANLRFVEVRGGADPTIDFAKVHVAPGTAGQGGVAWSWRGPELTGYESFAVFDAGTDLARRPDLLRHEIGHALGLAHPFEHPAVPSHYDHNGYTVMSYTHDPAGRSVGETYEVLDIMALQDLWGANPGAMPRGGRLALGDVGAGTLAVVDAAVGVDAIEAGPGRRNAEIDLREGAYSFIDGERVALVVLDAVVRTAIGGAGNDRLDGGAAGEVLAGRAGDDALSGRGGADVLRGGGGDDRLLGGAGDDRLLGGRGDDRIEGGAGADAVRGGRGRDEIAGGGGADRLWGGGGADGIAGGRGNDLLGGGAGADRLEGGAGRDVLHGGAQGDLLRGGGGADALHGGTGDDVLEGERGADALHGGRGADRLHGGAGADDLSGGRGRDVLAGGAGADTFRFARGDGRDVIRDLGRGDDALVLTGFGTRGDVLRAAEARGDDVVLDLGADTLILRGAALADLDDALVIG